jgi:hypothetical protein
MRQRYAPFRDLDAVGCAVRQPTRLERPCGTLFLPPGRVKPFGQNVTDPVLGPEEASGTTGCGQQVDQSAVGIMLGFKG